MDNVIFSQQHVEERQQPILDVDPGLHVSPLGTLQSAVVVAEDRVLSFGIAPPPYDMEAPPPYYCNLISVRDLTLSSLVAVDSSEDRVPFMRRMQSPYNDGGVQQHFVMGTLSHILHSANFVPRNFSMINTSGSVVAVPNFVFPSIYCGVLGPSLVVTSIRDVGGCMQLSVIVRTGRRGYVKCKLLIRVRVTISVNRLDMGCYLLPCFFIRGACVVANSVMFFLFGRLVTELCSRPDRSFFLFYSLFDIIVGFPSIFLLISIIRNNGVGSLFTVYTDRSLCKNIELIFHRLLENMVPQSSLNYSLQEVKEEVIAFPPPYMEEDLPPAYTKEAEQFFVPTLSLESLTVGRENMSLGQRLICLTLKVMSRGIISRHMLRIGCYRNQVSCVFLPRCVGVRFFYKYFYLMMLFFPLGIASGFYRKVKVSKDWIGTVYMLCPLLSVLLLGVVAGFSRGSRTDRGR